MRFVQLAELAECHGIRARGNGFGVIYMRKVYGHATVRCLLIEMVGKVVDVGVYVDTRR